ncbi:inositol polyphosphate-5-phosphatase A-like [Corticium candelabrum]|uniref:inositol polyphosphate-5-phosphatase A-like n=1 Tax=Corticium candelabrum TaxID=121492 RepID=UPI002E2600E9|nr:inositol polyphosphate-5-phosphatase A-like [Corticium candelabrum]
MDGHVCVMLVTSNVGSAFEEPDDVQQIWLCELLEAVRQGNPHFLAVHLQELGGKHYESTMKNVQSLVRSITNSDVLKNYDRMLVLLDENMKNKETFTALGSLYFIHKSFKDIQLWSFTKQMFEPISGKTVVGGSLSGSEAHQKVKFPADFFPEFRWSRKGFLNTKWNMCGRVVNLVNVHLFHDASNLRALEQSPSPYCLNRRRAMEHVMKLVTREDGSQPVSTFYFGDFNFRLDLQNVVKSLCGDMSPQWSKKSGGEVYQAVYRREGENSDTVLTIAEKLFQYKNSSEFLINSGEKFLEFDVESQYFKDLHELDLTFPPSYPYSEDSHEGTDLLTTRCPAWCDRVLFNNQAKQDLSFASHCNKLEYGMIGRNVCTGDHKPIFMQFVLPRNAGQSNGGNSTRTAHSAGDQQPAYLTLMLVAIACSAVLLATMFPSL